MRDGSINNKIKIIKKKKHKENPKPETWINSFYSVGGADHKLININSFCQIKIPTFPNETNDCWMLKRFGKVLKWEIGRFWFWSVKWYGFWNQHES